MYGMSQSCQYTCAHTYWMHKQQVKEAVKNVAPGQAKDKINDRTLQMILPSSPTRENNIASITAALH